MLDHLVHNHIKVKHLFTYDFQLRLCTTEIIVQHTNKHRLYHIFGIAQLSLGHDQETLLVDRHYLLVG